MDDNLHIGRSLSDLFDTKKYAGIPTMYRGIEFRSRLEARWAAFFDQCGWKWNYEPFDLPGWIPDFTLGPQSALVEIKPFSCQEQWHDEVEKIKKANPNQRVILFGESPTLFEASQGFAEGPQVGWLLEPWETLDRKPDYHVCDLHFGFTEGNNELGLCPMQSGWDNLIWNFTGPRANKESRVWLETHEVETVLSVKWANACNITKWKPSNGRGYR